jgi:hypothetical protein
LLSCQCNGSKNTVPDADLDTQREVIDALERTVMRYEYDMLGNRVRSASMEAGERWMLGDVSGKPIRSWDSRGHAFRTEYDALRRPLRVDLRCGGEHGERVVKTR